MADQFVAFGTGTTAATSPDGATWTTRTSNATASALCWNGSVYVALPSNSATAQSSPDGITWTDRTLPVSGQWSAVAWNGAVFCAVMYGSSIAATSPDGITWTQRALPSSQYWYYIAWNGSTFLAAEQDASSVTATSADGVTWSAGATLTGYVGGIACKDGVFCVVQTAGRNAYTSADGVNWTTTSNALPSAASWYAVASDGTQFVASTYDSTAVATSPDGVTWTSRTLPTGCTGRGLCWNGSAFLALTSGSTNAATSPDGATWTLRTMPSSSAWSSAVGVVLPYSVPVTITSEIVAAVPTLQSGSDGVIVAFQPATLLSGSDGAALSAPAPILAAQDVFGAFQFDQSAPPPTLFSGNDGVALSAPAPTLDAYAPPATGAIATVSVVATAPALVSGATAVTATAPIPTISSTLVAVTWSVDLRAPLPEAASEVLTGTILEFDNSAPIPLLDAGAHDIRLQAPAPALEATLLPGRIITVSVSAPAAVLSAALDNRTIITAENTAAMPVLSAALAAGQVATAALAAGAPQLSATALTGNVATVLATAATPIMEALGYSAFTISFAGAAPPPRLSATLVSAAVETYRTWVLNTRNGALTEYNGFTFNSYAVFNGKVIAASSAGIVELGAQASDAGTAIAAVATTGEESFGSSLHKRIPRIYLGHSADGDLRFSTVTTEGGTRTYALDWNGVPGTQQRRIPVGKGPRSRFWQFTVRNVDGADFEINDMLVDPVKLRRRVE